MSKVFISYARGDGDVARDILHELRHLNITGWMDASDIAAGAALPAAIRDALNKSEAVLVLLSPGALQSQWVNFEVGAAEALGKTIIPVLIKGDVHQAMAPEILRDRNWLDARDRPASDVAREIEAALP